MPCFYCGKRVSLARQLRDADFCSDDHRKRYHELGRAALSRLLESSQQPATSVSGLTPPPAPPIWNEQAEFLPPPPKPGGLSPIQFEPPSPLPVHKHRPFEKKHPIFVMPPPAAPVPPPPISFVVEPALRPTAAAGAPALAELQAAGPVFDGEKALNVTERPELRGYAFVSERNRMTPPANMPARSAGAGGNGFHRDSPYTGRLDDSQVLGMHRAERLPLGRLLVRQPRPATPPMQWQAAIAVAGRATPRPLLTRPPAAKPRSARLDPCQLMDYPVVAANRVFVSRPAVAAFLEFPRRIHLTRFQRRPVRAAVPACGLEPLSVPPLRSGFRTAAEPPALFRPAVEAAGQSRLRLSNAPRVAAYGELAPPRAAAGRARVFEAGPLAASPAPAIPERAGRIAGPLFGTTPPLVESWSVALPRPVPQAATGRSAAAAAFAAGELSLPARRARARVAGGMREAALELLGFPAVARPPRGGPAQAGEPALPLGRQPAMPALAVRRSSRVVVAPGSWMWTAAPSARRPRSGFVPAIEITLAPAAISYPRTAVPPAVRRLSVAELSFLATGSGWRGAAAELQSEPPQFGAVLGWIERPRLPEAGTRRQVRTAGAAPPARLPHTVGWRLQPQAMPAATFHVEGQTPVCTVQSDRQVARAPYATAAAPQGAAGARTTVSASAAFPPQSVPRPGFVASAVTVTLAAARYSPVPPALRQIAAAAIAAPAPAIEPVTDLLAAPLTTGGPQRVAALTQVGERPLKPPAARAVAPSLPPPASAPIEPRRFLPAAPGALSGTRSLPQPAHQPLAASASHRALRPAAAEGVPMPAAAATAPAAKAVARWRPELGAGTPLAGGVPPLGGSRRNRSCAWEQPGVGAPEVAGTMAALRAVAELVSATFETAAYRSPAAKAPAAPARQSAEQGFGIQAAELPPAREVRAAEALAGGGPERLAVHSFAPAAARAIETAIGFPEHEAARPERPAGGRRGRRLEEAALAPAPEGRSHDLSAFRMVRVREVLMALTADIAPPAGKFQPLRRMVLGTPELEKLPEAVRCAGRRRAAAPGAIELAVPRPMEPNSAALAARETLLSAAAIGREARSFRGAARNTAVAIVPESTERVAMPGAAPLELAHPLRYARPFLPKAKALDLAAGRREESWLALGQETAALHFEGIGSRATGVSWPTAASFEFARERQMAARSGVSAIADRRLAQEFAVPELRRPSSAGYVPALAPARLAELAAAAKRDDARTAGITVRLAPAFRAAFHPSRLPIFRTLPEKAHMPSGRVFYGFEIEDREDDRTSATGLPCPAPLVEPAAPKDGFLLRTRSRLETAELGELFTGPYGQRPRRANGYAEWPYNQELFFIDTGVRLIGMDFEAIVEAYEPRWRSALKTASGLFRGVMLFIPGLIILSTLLSGCSSSGNSSFRASIQNRAAIHMEHDFASGLEGWYGGRGWAKAWSRDPSGHVRAGQLGLYRPSLQLTDYRLEFLTQIDRRSVGWAYRAADLQNYYATRLVIEAPGPPPQMALVRYQVVGGQEVQPIKLPLRILLHRNRPFRIQQDVVGNGFTTYIEGEAVDFWTDDRLRTGGVGFLGDGDDRPYLYWVHVSSHDDFWGKICAMIAPNN